MIHGLNNSFLYSAKKLIVKISDGKTIYEIRGTGFFIKKDDELVLVTNRHMVEPGMFDAKLQGFSVDRLFIESFQSFDEEGKPLNYSIKEVLNYGEFVVADNALNDVACLKGVKVPSPGISIIVPIDYKMLADQSWFDRKLCVCDTIAYPGFSDWYDEKNDTPIFRMGTIASDPRFDYARQKDNIEEGVARVIYEGFSSGGASGSPVFAVQKGFQVGGGIIAPKGFFREVKLIGINAGHYGTDVVLKVDKQDEGKTASNSNGTGDVFNNNELDDKKDAKMLGLLGHSGISYFIKSTVIMDMIDKLCP